MAIEKQLKSGLFNTLDYNNPDRRYQSKDFTDTASFSHNGYVSGIKQEFFVESVAGLVIDVNTGIYMIDGHYINNETVKSFNLAPTQAGKERYDIVVVGVTRDPSKIIDGVTLSREGYVRVIEGVPADIDKAAIPYNQLITEELLNSSGTLEVELAIIKVITGSVESIIDKRVSTTTEEIKTYITKEVDANWFVNMEEYNLQSSSEVDTEGNITSGNAFDIIDKEISLVLTGDEGIFKGISIKINGVPTNLYSNGLIAFVGKGNNVYKFKIFKLGSKLMLTQEVKVLTGSIERYGFVSNTGELLNTKTNVITQLLNHNGDIEGTYDIASFVSDSWTKFAITSHQDDGEYLYVYEIGINTPVASIKHPYQTPEKLPAFYIKDRVWFVFGSQVYLYDKDLNLLDSIIGSGSYPEIVLQNNPASYVGQPSVTGVEIYEEDNGTIISSIEPHTSSPSATSNVNYLYYTNNLFDSLNEFTITQFEGNDAIVTEYVVDGRIQRSSYGAKGAGNNPPSGIIGGFYENI